MTAPSSKPALCGEFTLKVSGSLRICAKVERFEQDRLSVRKTVERVVVDLDRSVVRFYVSGESYGAAVEFFCVSLASGRAPSISVSLKGHRRSGTAPLDKATIGDSIREIGEGRSLLDVARGALETCLT